MPFSGANLSTKELYTKVASSDLYTPISVSSVDIQFQYSSHLVGFSGQYSPENLYPVTYMLYLSQSTSLEASHVPKAFPTSVAPVKRLTTIPSCILVASSPGPTQILSRSCGEKSLRDKIWVGPGDEASILVQLKLHVCRYVFSENL